MILRRIAAVVMVCGGLGVIGPACTSVIGGLGDDDNVDVVAKMCLCSDELSFLGTPQQCQGYLTDRFGGMTADERQDFLEFYAESCRTCDKVKSCFYRDPVCKTIGCTIDEECCSAKSGGGCHAGKCI
ncbi:MAG: hypothetical protein QM820_41260 [Minicystis sp.]